MTLKEFGQTALYVTGKVLAAAWETAAPLLKQKKVVVTLIVACAGLFGKAIAPETADSVAAYLSTFLTLLGVS